MATKNGADILLLVEDPVGSGIYVVVGSQRDVKFDEKIAAIDTSSKDSPQATFIPGRYSATCVLNHVYVPSDQAYLALRAALRNRTIIQVRRQEFGLALETASAIVTLMTGEFKDQAESTIAIDLQITGAWA